MATSRSKLLRLGVTALVLLPFWWAGGTGVGAPWLPWQVREVWAFAQLFTAPQPTWSSRHVQLLGQDGRWYEVPHDPPFRHALFGSQTRLDWLLIYLEGPVRSDADRERRRRVWRQLCDGYAALYAGGPLAAERLPPAALPARRTRLLTFYRPSSIERPPPAPYSTALPGPLEPGNHEILVTCPVLRAEDPS